MARVIGFLLCLLASAAEAEAPSMVLPAEVVVRGPVVRLADLGAPESESWAHVVVMAAPAPGHEIRLDRRQILRECVRAGVRPVPHLKGADEVRLLRSGVTASGADLVGRIVASLTRTPLPAGALDQRFEIERAPDLKLSSPLQELRVEGGVPRVGAGSVAVRLQSEDGRRRRLFVKLRRFLRVDALETVQPIEAGHGLDPSLVRADTLWTDDRIFFDRRLRASTDVTSWTAVRALPGGHFLQDRDLRPTPVVHRGESVNWIVERAGLSVTLRARARGSGVTGDWILVQSPLDGHLHRVCIIGPGTVADHLPPKSAQAATASARPDVQGGHR